MVECVTHTGYNDRAPDFNNPSYVAKQLTQLDQEEAILII